MNPKTTITGHEIAPDDRMRTDDWAAAKKKSFEVCQILQPYMRWQFAFNVVVDIVQSEHKLAKASALDVEMWCKEAYELFEED